MFLALMLYGWSIIPFVYVQSFLCKVASTASTWIIIINIILGMHVLLFI